MSHIDITYDGPVATVVINRPEAINALNHMVLTELKHACDELEAQTSVRAVIITGAGNRAFVSGADIAEMREMKPRAALAFSGLGHSVMTAIEHSMRPWIAAISGYAFGGGCELALACDLIYASTSAKLGQPEVNLGVIPGFGGTVRLVRRVGVGRAKELILTGKIIGAEEALRIGLVDAVVAPNELLPLARKTAEEMASKGPLAVAVAKRLIVENLHTSEESACDQEAAAFSLLFDTVDQKEGMAAFVEKRKAKFAGR